MRAEEGLLRLWRCRPSVAERDKWSPTAEILAYESFAEHVGLKTQEGTYFEADPDFWKGSVYWAQGVRPLSDSTFERILAAAEVSNSVRATQVAPKVPTGGSGGGYARPSTALEVERYSVRQVIAALRAEFPGFEIYEMPRSNPGFDIRVGPGEQPVLYVEVKGTQSADPVFFMSEGERAFSCRNADRYRLHVVVGIDLKTETHASIEVRGGGLQRDDCGFRATQWRGTLAPSGA